ncbi:Diadenosine tetraphosphate (Ap4A) hydrolase [Modicisalibacter ilicicola DSM 19980]|uniref:Diadenosine tetraphosphate (Ap4A) hydrolase n=1 Tax=Modicisalibacter ilicicola DSM 19980 TaxID=1121942 RepID=A0A1M5B6E9_9GAMM|nr:HIT family protein [Halomonas ilicicola]SHF38083.1 Diadenosine tetraphosphate (Ap4A) hydrolase [Halomonas ilicicola DSM 19980]
MSDFSLHPRLAADTHPLTDLTLCQVRLMDDARFLWLILVPRRPGIREVYELDERDQARLWQEATGVGKAVQTAFEGDKLNLATLGNQVPQLHLHVILRRQDDAAWPAPVWGVGQAQPYAPERLDELRERLLAVVEAAFEAD